MTPASDDFFEILRQQVLGMRDRAREVVEQPYFLVLPAWAKNQGDLASWQERADYLYGSGKVVFSFAEVFDV